MSEYPDARFLTSAAKPRQFVADSGAEVAFAGRSNAGKSTAINRIVNRRNFARTSKQPGRTQLVNFFDLGQDRRLVDLPGYGFARVSQSMRDNWKILLETYFETRKCLVGTIIVVDSRRGLGDIDRQMIHWCESIERPTHVLLTKVDKLKKMEAQKTLRSVRDELEGLATVQMFSGTKDHGLDEARKTLDELFDG